MGRHLCRPMSYMPLAAFFQQHVVRLKVSVFRFQDLATRLPDPPEAEHLISGDIKLSLCMLLRWYQFFPSVVSEKA